VPPWQPKLRLVEFTREGGEETALTAPKKNAPLTLRTSSLFTSSAEASSHCHALAGALHFQVINPLLPQW